MQNDRYRKTRGGYSRMLELSCAKHGHKLCMYQKDGSGILKRLYLDRIDGLNTKSKNLTCSNCKELLGVKVIYKKENRPAYRLFAGAVSKQIIKQGF